MVLKIKTIYTIRKGKYPEQNVEVLHRKLAEEGAVLQETTIDGQPYYRWEGLDSQKPKYLGILQSGVTQPIVSRPEFIDRRKAIKRLGAIAAAGIVIGIGGLVTYSNRTHLRNPTIPKNSNIIEDPVDPNVVKGVVVALVEGNSDGGIVYQRDVCHGVDQGTEDGEILIFVLDRDAKYECRDGMRESGGDIVNFTMWFDEVYSAGDGTLVGRDIMDKIKLEDYMEVEKGEEVREEYSYMVGKILKAPWL